MQDMPLTSDQKPKLVEGMKGGDILLFNGWYYHPLVASLQEILATVAPMKTPTCWPLNANVLKNNSTTVQLQGRDPYTPVSWNTGLGSTAGLRRCLPSDDGLHWIGFVSVQRLQRTV